MDDEVIEDMVGEVNYTESANSIETESYLYSNDFEVAESTSIERINSSGKNTYVIDYDSEDSAITSNKKRSLDRNMTSLLSIKCIHQSILECNLDDASMEIAQETPPTVPKEICTQTSKTIIEIAEKEGMIKKPVTPITHNLETQTSLLTIIDEREITTEAHKIEMVYAPRNDDDFTENSSEEDVKTILYNKLFENEVELTSKSNFGEPNLVRKVETLTPLTEESCNKSYNDADMQRTKISTNFKVTYNTTELLPNEDIKARKQEIDEKPFKLPPIMSCPNSPQITLLKQKRSLIDKALTLPCLFDTPRTLEPINRWQTDSSSYYKENTSEISARNDYKPREILPPVQTVSTQERRSRPGSINSQSSRSRYLDDTSASIPSDVPQSVRKRIKEMKINTHRSKMYGVADSGLVQRRNSIGKNKFKCPLRTPEPEAMSPHGDCIDRDTDNILSDREIDKDKDGRSEEYVDWTTAYYNIIQKLGSESWMTIVEVLDNISTILSNHWNDITEHHITELLRQVSQYIDSPRTIVTRSACFATGNILKMTNYTKRPDFYELVTALLVKTSSSNKTIRRAANVALDDIVSNVGLHHAVRALCAQGVSHKSALVRCATARLLVCCIALAGGQQYLLKSNLPGSVVAARRIVFQALSTFIEDKNTETRKYAERLYAMLRPHKNFEAYFLTDIDMEIAIQQMKKYDAIFMRTNS